MVLDIVAFVDNGSFPRSRLGEKQRGKILAGWVSRKMQTIAQFSIRDPDADGSVGTAVPEEQRGRRGSAQSFRTTGAGSMRHAMGTNASSLRHVESVADMPVLEEGAVMQAPSHHEYMDSNAVAHPEDFFELPPPGSSGVESRSDATPTNENPRPLQLHPSMQYSPVESESYDDQLAEQQDQASRFDFEPEQAVQEDGDADIGNDHGHSFYHDEGEEDDGDVHDNELDDDSAVARPPQAYPEAYTEYSPVEPPQHQEEYGGPRMGGGLRITNRTSSASDDWEKDALASLNLGPNRRIS